MSSEMRDAQEIGDVRSLLRSLRHAVRNILVAGLGFVVVGVILTEAASTLLAHAWPTINVHLVAAVVGLLLGYAAAVTVALRETVRGVLSSLERVVAEFEHAGARLTHDIAELADQPGVRYTGRSSTGTAATPAAPAASTSRYPGGNGAVTTVIGPVGRVVEAASAGPTAMPERAAEIDSYR